MSRVNPHYTKDTSSKKHLTNISKPNSKYGNQCKCSKCNYVWYPRSKSPLRCPRCNSLM